MAWGSSLESPGVPDTKEVLTHSPTLCESLLGAQRKGWGQGRRIEGATTCFLNLFKLKKQKTSDPEAVA